MIGINTDRLRRLREQHGWSQRELARRCNLSPTMVRKYEVGEHDPTAHALKLLAEHLEVSVDYLLGLSDDPQMGVRHSLLDDNEQTMLDVYRREGWHGVARLSVERLAK